MGGPENDGSLDPERASADATATVYLVSLP